ncbi:MAG: cupin domain-containing protein [Actinobacteria bacterium]|nr:cupin domain-containing protein [Actinomycetota bacterium]
MSDSTSAGNAYAEAGVSIEAADKAIELMKVWVEKAKRPEMIGGLGGFAGLFDASALTRYKRPLLATSTDGVGTKVAIAQAMDVHDTIGYDLVGMVVDDLVVCGAEPLFMTDYIATGRVVPERIAAIVKGIAEVTLDGKVMTLRENESTYIPIGGVHRLANPGTELLEVVEVQTGDYVEEDDIVRYEDIYARV